MKNYLILFLFAISFLTFSCNKEVISPNCHPKNHLFNNDRDNQGWGHWGCNNNDDDDHGITDPNNDPDINRKKGGHR